MGNLAFLLTVSNCCFFWLIFLKKKYWQSSLHPIAHFVKVCCRCSVAIDSCGRQSDCDACGHHQSFGTVLRVLAFCISHAACARSVSLDRQRLSISRRPSKSRSHKRRVGFWRRRTFSKQARNRSRLSFFCCTLKRKEFILKYFIFFYFIVLAPQSDRSDALCISCSR